MTLIPLGGVIPGAGAAAMGSLLLGVLALTTLVILARRAS